MKKEIRETIGLFCGAGFFSLMIYGFVCKLSLGYRFLIFIAAVILLFATYYCFFDPEK